MLNKFYKTMAAALLSAICLSGCGRNTSDDEKALADFSVSISDFSKYIQEVDGKINSLDVSKRESTEELLEILDDMDEKFSIFAEVEVPIQYYAVENLANEASENMSQAVSYYHSAYESEEFNKSFADAAYEYYTRAMTRVTYIGYVLSGEGLPDNDNIIIHEESNDSNILDKWLSGDDKDADKETAPE